MIAGVNVFATIAVSDIARGKEFYGGTLGLHQADEKSFGVMYTSGSGRLFIYESQTAGSGQATCAAWEVEDVAACVEALKRKSIVFEHYDLPGAELQGDVHVSGSMKSAWFKDPDGNILSVANND